MMVAAAWLGFTAVRLPPARAQGDAAPVPAAVAKAAATGTPRLVRIGPQALIEVHGDGRMNMVDEPPRPRSRAAALAVFLGVTFGVAAVPVTLPELSGATNPAPIR